MKLSTTIWIAGATLTALAACSQPNTTSSSMPGEQMPPAPGTERDAELSIHSEDQINHDANAIDANNADAELDRLTQEVEGDTDH